MVAGVAQSVQRLAMGWAVRDRIPVVTRFSAPFQTGCGAHPASYKMGTESFLGVKWPRGGVDHHHIQYRSSRKSTAISILPLWAFVACYIVNFTFTFTLFHGFFLRNLRPTISRLYWIKFRLPIFHLPSHLIIPLQLFKLSFGTNLFVS